MTRQGTAERPAAQRARIALAFETRDRPGGTPGDVAAGAPTAAPAGADSEDVTFQVSLPRGVVRQLDMLAVEKDTTQRAVLLRALRLAGLSVPEGSIADPRVATRRSQA